MGEQDLLDASSRLVSLGAVETHVAVRGVVILGDVSHDSARSGRARAEIVVIQQIDLRVDDVHDARRACDADVEKLNAAAVPKLPAAFPRNLANWA